MSEAVARWDKFLAKIEGRLQEILAEARQGCAMLLDQSDLDPGAMGNAWTAMELRAKALSSKVQDTWNDKVEDDFEDADLPTEVADAARARGDALSERVDVETERTRIAIYADAARKIWHRAQTEAPTTLPCTQCGGSIEAPKVLASVNVACPFCRATNTFEPGMRARMIEHFCAHPLSEEAAWNEWLAMKNAEQTFHNVRTPALADFKAHEQAQIVYWRRYLEARAQMVPRHAPNLDADLRSKLLQWYQSVEHEKAWAAAGRPRALA